MSYINLFPTLSSYHSNRFGKATNSTTLTRGVLSATEDKFSQYFASYNSLDGLYTQINKIDLAKKLIEGGLDYDTAQKCTKDLTDVKLIWSVWDDTKAGMSASFNTIELFSKQITSGLDDAISYTQKIIDQESVDTNKVLLEDALATINTFAAKSAERFATTVAECDIFSDKLDGQPALISNMQTEISNTLKLEIKEQQDIMNEIISLKKKIDAYNAGAIAAGVAGGGALIGLGITMCCGPIGWLTFSLFIGASIGSFATMTGLLIAAENLQSKVNLYENKYKQYSDIVASLTSAQATLITASKTYESATTALPDVAEPWKALVEDMTKLTAYIKSEGVDYNTLLANLTEAKTIWASVMSDCDLLSDKTKIKSYNKVVTVSDVNTEDKLKAVVAAALAA